MSVWSDARIVALAKEFTPCADEVWRLQRGLDQDCQFFQRMVHDGELHSGTGSLQGAWVFAPSGKRLARINSRNADKVLATLERGLEEWRALPDSERWLASDAELDPAHRWEDNWPLEGLALRRLARDLPDEETSGSRKRFNWDTAWFSKDEVAAFVPADYALGSTFELKPLIQRLACFHLVDNVKGQTLPFAPSEVDQAELHATVTKLSAGLVELELQGHTRAAAPGPWLLGDNLWKPKREWPRGLELALAGRATWDTARQRFTQFDLIGVGRRFGRSAFNGRARAELAGRIGFHVELAPDRPRVAPTFVALYGADWIVPPANRDELEYVPDRMR